MHPESLDAGLRDNDRTLKIQVEPWQFQGFFLVFIRELVEPPSLTVAFVDNCDRYVTSPFGVVHEMPFVVVEETRIELATSRLKLGFTQGCICCFARSTVPIEINGRQSGALPSELFSHGHEMEVLVPLMLT